MAVWLTMAASAWGQTTFQAVPASLGPIPDSTMCGTLGPPRDVTFAVTGLGPVATVSVGLTASHPQAGELIVTLIAPSGSQHVIFAKTRATSDSLTNFLEWLGDDSDLGGTYAFADVATGGWWAAAQAAGTAEVIAPGSYRTSQPGGAGSTGQATVMNAAFSGSSANGTWTLRFEDRCAFDTGAVSAASLTIGTTPVTITSQADAYAVTYAMMLSVPAPGVLANDTTTSGTLAATLVSGPAHGVLTFNTDGSFQYSSFSGYSGPDSYVYRASAGGGIGSDTTVTLTVGTPAPQGVADAYTVDMERTLTATAPGVLANDVAVSSPMTAELVTGPQYGTLSLEPSGAFTYTPTTGFFGADSFVYRPVLAGRAGSSATVSLTVQGVPQPPTGLDVAWIRQLTKWDAPHEVALRWQAPRFGPRPTSYVLEGGTSSGAAQASVEVAADYPITIALLKPGAYFMRVYSVVDGVRSSASAEVTFGVNRAGRSPGTPTDFNVAVNGAAMTVSWKASYWGDTPRSWRLDYEWTAPGGQPVRGFANLPASDEYLKVDAVPPGSYALLLTANGPDGASDFVFKGISVPSSCTATPDAPTATLAFVRNGTIGIMWDPPASGQAPTHYYVHVSGGANISLPTARRLLTAPAVPGTFTLSVSAANACGESARTPVQTITIP